MTRLNVRAMLKRLRRADRLAAAIAAGVRHDWNATTPLNAADRAHNERLFVKRDEEAARKAAQRKPTEGSGTRLGGYGRFNTRNRPHRQRP